MQNYQQPWHRLNISVTGAITPAGYATIEQWKSSVGDLPGGYWKLYEDSGLLDFFSSEFLQRMKEAGAPIDMAVFFYRKAHYNHPTSHIDGSESYKPYYAINWVLTPEKDDSDMVWFSMPDNLPPPVTGAYGTANYDINETGLDEVGRCCIGDQMTLVRVDIPHNIIVREQPRVVISMRSRELKVDSWQHAVDYFRPYIIE